MEPVTDLLDQLRSLAEDVLAGAPIPALIGVAFPGPVDAEGRVSRAPTLWGHQSSEPLELARHLSSALWDRPTRLVNDLTAAGFRYAAPGVDFCLVTVSSGIGNKVFLDGRPVLGQAHRGGEIGHWRVDGTANAPLCECGERGHLGAISSGRSVAQHVLAVEREQPELVRRGHAGRRGKDLNADIARAFRAGDPFAQAVVRRGAQALGSALALLHVSIGLERFIIIGGWAQALGPLYLEELARAAADSAWGPQTDWRKRIEAGAPDDDSGLIGMGRLLDLDADKIR